MFSSCREQSFEGWAIPWNHNPRCLFHPNILRCRKAFDFFRESCFLICKFELNFPYCFLPLYWWTGGAPLEGTKAGFHLCRNILLWIVHFIWYDDLKGKTKLNEYDFFYKYVSHSDTFCSLGHIKKFYLCLSNLD